ncbi:MAG: hypothetical protein KJ970_00535 [Candidatus Eisenbacteria bacterium]|uniref:DUF4870 domain-containing protein n=1 Tax=Eiseniibacteriota bacterium TaxID=2212470 RepID=A0A948RSV4_UNCEI|nr:hypothetical protein [Candidatus Eisenbacteria bacterium]MBU1948630.1 hypothetical protein [Candidatus Eisenbacteria bacterium]MBU2689386.1 hypothetical protein [Candidatus Eisenbacteria bacterium]
MSFQEKESSEKRVWGAGAYFLGAVGAVVVLLVRREPFCRFHAVQSIITTVVLFLVGLLLKGLAYLPIFGFLYGFLFRLFQVGVFALWIFLMFQAWRGRQYRLPYIGSWAEDSAGPQENPKPVPLDARERPADATATPRDDADVTK